MTAATFIDLRINNAEQLRESLSEEESTKLYLIYGRTEGWANDQSPPIANSSVSSYNEIWFNMIGGKRILGGDIRNVIKRYDWKSGDVYVAYDNLNYDLYNEKFYVVNSDFSVYKCISNNYSTPSTTEPTSTNPYSTFTTADGYIWKYMYTVSDFEKMFFTTDTYIPVKTLTINDGSYQWQVQNDASAIKGGIMAAVVTNGGNNYTNAANIIVTFAGDGFNTTGRATINTATNTVNSVIITDPGFNHTYCNIDIYDTANVGNGAIARAILSPPGGHGSDPLYELGGRSVMINTRLKYDENGILPVKNDYRQISLLKDPYLRSTQNVASNVAIFQGITLTAEGTSNFEEDEFVYQGSSLEAATFSGVVLSWDEITNILKVTNTRGTPVPGLILTGLNSFTVRTITSITLGDLEKYSGRILYTDNIKPVFRSNDQIEDYRIVIEF